MVPYKIRCSLEAQTRFSPNELRIWMALHIGATMWIRPDDWVVAMMRPYVELLAKSIKSNYSIGTAQWTTAHLQECLNERYCRCLLFYRAYFYAHGSCSSCCGDVMQVQCDMEESSAAAKPSTSDTATAAVSAGVLEDFESFIEKFTSTQSVRYEQFAEIWKELQMSLIFAGRQSDQECREVYLQDISATPHLAFF